MHRFLAYFERWRHDDCRREYDKNNFGEHFSWTLRKLKLKFNKIYYRWLTLSSRCSWTNENECEKSNSYPSYIVLFHVYPTSFEWPKCHWSIDKKCFCRIVSKSNDAKHTYQSLFTVERRWWCLNRNLIVFFFFVFTQLLSQLVHIAEFGLVS